MTARALSAAVAVYADGGVILSNPSAIGGTWATCHVDASGARIWEASGVILPADVGMPFVSNNQSEFYALLMGLEAVPDGWSGRACSDSSITLARFFRMGKLNGIPFDWRARLSNVLGRLGRVESVLLDGHPTRAQLAAGIGRNGHPVSAHNCWCDRRCTEEARRHVAEVTA